MNSDTKDEARRRLRESDAARKLRARRAAAEAVWYVSPDGENPDGPHTGAAVIDMYASGQVPTDLLIWREGMEDWLAIDNAQGLGAVIDAGPGAAQAGPTGADTARQGATLSMSFDLPRPTPGSPPGDRTGVSLDVSPPAPGAPGADKTLAAIEQASSMVIAHMNETQARLADRLGALSENQQQRYLAFELGALEFYRQTLLVEACGSAAQATKGFFTLLVYHATEHYPQNSEAVITFWHGLESGQEMLEIRELGFHSIADGLNDAGTPKHGHYAADYLCDALGLARND